MRPQFNMLPYFVVQWIDGMQAYHAHEIAVMYQHKSGTFKFRVLTDKLMGTRLSDYGRSDAAK